MSGQPPCENVGRDGAADPASSAIAKETLREIYKVIAAREADGGPGTMQFSELLKWVRPVGPPQRAAYDAIEDVRNIVQSARAALSGQPRLDSETVEKMLAGVRISDPDDRDRIRAALTAPVHVEAAAIRAMLAQAQLGLDQLLGLDTTGARPLLDE